MKYFYCCLVLILIGCNTATNNSGTQAKPDSSEIENRAKAYVLQKNEGEVLVDGAGRTIIIKVSPETGAAHISMGLEHHPIGAGTIIHKHDHSEEILFVHKGTGYAIIDGDTIEVQEGATMFIPPGTWHGIDNPKDSMDILYMVTPQGLEKLFRGIGAPPGVTLKELTQGQLDSIEIAADSKAKKN